ncbi:MAG: glycosyltransferase family 39 protein [Acidobacteriota bacterium]
MHDAPLPRSSRSALDLLWVAALLTLHGALAVTSGWIKSATYDEVSHLPAGLAAVSTGELHLNRQHPPLVKLLAGWSAGTLEPNLPLGSEAYRRAEEWNFGFDVLFEQGNDAWALLRRGRLPTTALSMLGGLVVFLWGRRAFGRGAAFLALGLYALSPSVLAQARWVTMDTAVTALGMAALYGWWRLARSGDGGGVDVGWRWIAPCGLALGLALGSKWSALVLIPAMALAELLDPRGPGGRSGWKLRGLRWGGVLATAGLTVWGIYLFPADPWFYFRDLGGLYGDLPEGYRFYLAGTFQEQRFPHYFLATFALKSTPVELAVAALAAAGGVWTLRRPWAKDDGAKIEGAGAVGIEDAQGAPWADDLYLWIPAAAWLAATSLLATNQGHRYILLLYPLLFVLAGRGLGLLTAALPSRRRYLASLVVVALMTAQVAETFAHHPDYLPYFNRPSGGVESGPRWLDDSNVDWNQDVGRLGPWLASHGVTSARTVFLGRTGAAYYGVPTEPFLEADWRVGPRPGAYVLSAHVLSRGRELHAYEGWASDWLDRYRPVAVLGGSLYLYVFPGSEDPSVPEDAGP